MGAYPPLNKRFPGEFQAYTTGTETHKTEQIFKPPPPHGQIPEFAPDLIQSWSKGLISANYGDDGLSI